jgi:YebC/PmpR family DNA-binding regulatory protein
MAGHSKWANIKHRKAAQDAKRGKIFTKLIRELVVAARSGGGDPADNPRLRAAMDKALGANMKKDTIEKAIARGIGDGEGDNYEENTYEGYAPGGVAIIVETMTDNKNRTVAEVRHAFSKHGGSLGTEGSVAFQFSKIGQIIFEPGIDEEEIMDAALESGAEDVIPQQDGSVEVQTAWEDFLSIKDTLAQNGFEAANAEVTMVAQNYIDLDVDGAGKLLRLIDRLEDLDDVQNVYSNGDISEAVMEQLGDE